MTSFGGQYPCIATWVQYDTIEIGYNDWDSVFLRIIDPGGGLE